MTLIKCSECQKEISDKAYTCPNCGNPIKEQKTTIQIDPAPLKRKVYRIRFLFFSSMSFFGFLLGSFLIIFGATTLAVIVFALSFTGLIGAIINVIGIFINEP